MYPQQPGGPPQQPGGAIAVTTKYHWLGWILAVLKPELHLNGHVAGRGWGRTVVPVVPGQHYVHVHVPYFLPPRFGPADLGVTVHPGQTVEVEYRAPMIGFLNGAIGAPPQKYPGMTATIVLNAVGLALLLCLCGGVVLAAIAGTSTSP